MTANSDAVGIDGARDIGAADEIRKFPTVSKLEFFARTALMNHRELRHRLHEPIAPDWQPPKHRYASKNVRAADGQCGNWKRL